jgi:hypothetical protein
MGSAKAKPARRAKATDVISHWAKLIEGMQMSTQEFYSRVERVLADRKVPGLEMSRVLWKEGGLFSARREYLRMVRERLIFDVCAAPFGMGFFVSTWFGEKRLRLGWLVCCLILIAVAAMADFMLIPIGVMRHIWWHYGFHTMIGTLVAVTGVALLALLAYFGQNLDRVLMRAPVIGYFYERYFRSITYYRYDLACMYQQAIHDAVTQVIGEISEAQGLAPLSETERRPVFRELFSSRHTHG